MTDQEREAQERASCPACKERRLHTEGEWENHPFAGGGGNRSHRKPE